MGRVSTEFRLADAVATAIGHGDFSFDSFALRMCGKSDFVKDRFDRLCSAWIHGQAMVWDQELYDKTNPEEVERYSRAARQRDVLSMF